MSVGRSIAQAPARPLRVVASWLHHHDALQHRSKAAVVSMRSLLGALAAATLVTACDKPDAVIAPQSLRGSQAAKHQLLPAIGSRMKRPDEEFQVALTREEPAIAGFFVDSAKNIVVYVVDSTRLASARAVLSQHMTADRLHLPPEFRGRPIVTRRADYTWQELSDWRDDVTERILGKVQGVISDDLDEERNRVTIGVDRNDAGAAIRLAQALGTLSIPQTAINIRKEDPPKLATADAARLMHTLWPTVDLTQQSDTLAGGLQVIRSDNAIGGTIGIYGDKGSTHGFLTASHLTYTFLGPDTTELLQDLAMPGYPIVGQENSDPSGTRHSDASFFSVVGSVPYRRGSIFRTVDRVSGSAGSVFIDTTKSLLGMTGGETFLSIGVTVDKIGRTTGWTYGTIAHTCKDIIVLTATIHCAVEAAMYLAGGDSGSPVFWYDGADGGILYGILFAGSGNDSYFSSYQEIVADLGSINVASDITVGVASVSGSGVDPISWTPDSP